MHELVLVYPRFSWSLKVNIMRTTGREALTQQRDPKEQQMLVYDKRYRFVVVLSLGE